MTDHDHCETRRNHTTAQLIFVWGLSLVMSVTATGLSVYTFSRDRIDYSCEKNGHNFEPRFEDASDTAKIEAILKSKEPAMGNAHSWTISHLDTLKRYVGDVCTYCGKGNKDPQ